MGTPPIFLSPLTAGVLAGAVAVLSLRAERRLSRWLLGLSLAVAWWSFGYAGELASAELATALAWLRLEYLGIVVTPVAWLGLAWAYAGRPPWRSWTLLALLAVPSATLLATWFVPAAIWKRAMLVEIGGDLLLETAHGPWYWIHTAFSYTSMAAGTLLVLGASLRGSAFYRRRLPILLLGAVVPWLANGAYVFGWTRIDWTSLAFSLSALLLLWGLGYLRLLATRPVAANTLFEHLDDAMLVVGADGRVLDGNPALRPLLGGEVALAIGTPLADCAPSLAAALAAHLEIGAPATTSRSGLPVAGETHVYDFTSFPLPVAAGEPASRLIVLRDASVRERSERRLRENNSRFGALFDHLQAGVLIETAAGRVWRVNRSFCRLFSIARNPAGLFDLEAGEIHRWCAAASADGGAFLDRVSALTHGGQRAAGEVLTLRDGRMIEREYDLIPGFGEAPGRLWIYRDVTALRRTESLLALAEARSRALLDNVRGVVWRAAPESHRFSEVSAGAQALLGFPRAQWLEEPDFWLAHVHEDDRERVREELLVTASSGRDLDLEYRMLRSDGSPLWIHEKASVLVSEGQPRALIGVLVDVSEERAAARALAERAQRLRGLVENSPVPMAIVALGEPRTIETVNASFTATFGYSQADLPDLDSWLDLTISDPDERLRLREVWLEHERMSLATQAAAAIGPIERSLRCRDGSIREALNHATFLHDLVLVQSVDLTERKRAERELAEAQSFLQTVVDTSPGMIFVTDERGRIEFANRFIADYYATTPELLVGRGTGDVHSPPDEAAGFVTDDHAVAREGLRIERRERNTAPDGSVHWFHTIKVPIPRPGGGTGVLGIATDVTAMHEAEVRATASEAAMERVLDAFQGLLYVVGPDRTFQFLRGSVREITGWSAEDVLSGRMPWRKIVHPDDWKLLEIETRNLAAIPNYVSSTTYRIVRRDGETRWIQDVASALEPDVDGAPRWQGSILDVTQRKQVELAQAQWHAQRSRFIANVMEAQEQERAHIGRELHDGIGQVLSGLQVRISTLAPRAADAVRGELAELRDICVAAAEDLKRLAMGLRPLALDHLGLGAALLRLVEEQSALHQVQIDLHLDPDGDWDALGSTTGIALYRIVQEALNNVGKHSKAKHAGVQLERRARGLRLVVEDDGIGFDGSLSARSGASRGLGLHGIEERAALLGGTCHIESSPGTGTILVVDLPVAD